MVTPKGVRDNSWRDVVDLSRRFGRKLDGWQELVLEAAMGERTDSTWAAKRVGLSVPRQNGKSELLVARALAGALLFGEKKIVISAHQQDTAREAFAKLMEIIEADANIALRARLDPKFGRGGVMNALNREAVRFTTGATIQFKARTGAGSKGFSSDCLLLDEAQILGSRAWTSINSTMSAMANPQVWLLGTPPQEEDDSYTFEMVRKSAMDGTSTATAWCEWGADPAARDFDPSSEFTRWSANPAWNIRINHEVVQGEYETYSPDRFNQDRLGIWKAAADKGSRLIPANAWSATATSEAPVGTRSLAITFSFDGLQQSVAGAVKHDDGIHVELVGAHSGSAESGTASLVKWLTDDPEKPERWRSLANVAIAGGGEAASLFDALHSAGVPKQMMHVMTTPQVLAGNAMLLDAVRDRSLTHPEVVEVWASHDGDDGPIRVDMDALGASVAVCDQKMRAGGWSWKATTPDGDALPIESVCMALWIAKTSRRAPVGERDGVARGRTPGRGRSAGRR